MSDVINWVFRLLEAEWEPSITGRHNTLPAWADIAAGEEKDSIKQTLRAQPVIRVVDGGNSEYTPLGFSWTHDQTVDRVTIEAYTSDASTDGGVLLFGETKGLANQSRYGGLAGEILRIIRKNRKGRGPYDQLRYSPQRNVSANEGTNIYRVDTDVELRRHADAIDTSI